MMRDVHGPEKAPFDASGVAEQLRAIARSKPGPSTAAIFDFDGTLIQGYSAGALYKHRFSKREIGLAEIAHTARLLSGPTMSQDQFDDLLGRGIRAWTGRPVEEIDELGEELFRTAVAGQLFHDMWRVVKAHQAHGHTVLIATSATRFQVAPLARELGIEHVLCTELEAVDGRLTGRIAGESLWGPGKLAAIEAFAASRDLLLADAFGYANGDEDVPFLTHVGRPCAVDPQPILADRASGEGWSAVYLPHRSGRINPGGIARTAGIYGSIVGAGVVGTVLGVATGSRRRGVDLATTLLAEVGTAVADIDVEVINEDNLWKHRPAVFIINHQSSLIDLLVTTRLLRGGFTAVAKAEAADVPVIGPLLKLADFAFLERSDSQKARAALGQAVERLAAGVSIVISPEGTRSLTPRIGRFKKGAFHLAMDAGVPIVPIVIRNSGELMWRNAKTVQPGTVQAFVHEPILTTGWVKRDLDRAVVEVEDLYRRTLAEWPSKGMPTQASDLEE